MPKGIHPRPSLEQRFWPKVEKTATCWLWRGLKINGYGQIAGNRKRTYVHRFSYEMAKGPIPNGLQLDHLCRVRHCVNPAHLEAVTAKVNVHRGTGEAGANARKTECHRGHPLSGNNLYVNPDGHRNCRTCNNERARAVRRYHAKAKERK